ncbi:MAG TPA: hypothetical protein VEG84_10155, partial [Thermoanaerobaculia bacterium]|nr:hypothetical protein [Thermoanaerobaculia bacterium]
TSHAVPLSGVARVDWVIAGAASPGPSTPVFFDLVAGSPFSDLVSRAAASSEGARLTWTTASHEGLEGWVVFRDELQADGRVVRDGPQIVPASEEAAESFRYAYIDSGTRAGTYYRYTVWAVTGDGVLAKAFSATLRAPE